MELHIFLQPGAMEKYELLLVTQINIKSLTCYYYKPTEWEN